jgi:hypothetical protein
VSNPRPPLFTSRFLAIWAVSFAAAAASFQLLPAAPFRIRDLGGSTATSGLFLGLLTYGSALSAPWTGARRMAAAAIRQPVLPALQRRKGERNVLEDWQRPPPGSAASHGA